MKKFWKWIVMMVVTTLWMYLTSLSCTLQFNSAALSSLTLCSPMDCSTPDFSVHLFSKESVLPIRWPKYWSFSFSISPCNEYSGLISLRMDWLELLTVQGTLKSLLQHHSLKVLVVRHSAFFMGQLSHAYMTTGKTIPLTIQTFLSKVMSLLFNTLSRFVIAS